MTPLKCLHKWITEASVALLHLHFRTSSLQQTIPYHSLLGHQLYRQPISFLLIIPGTAYELCRSIRLHRRNRLNVVQVSANWCLIYDALEENFPVHITISNYDFLFSVSISYGYTVSFYADCSCPLFFPWIFDKSRVDWNSYVDIHSVKPVKLTTANF